MLASRMTKPLVVALIVCAYLAAGYSSMPLSYCAASELRSIYGGSCNQACKSFDPCDGCDGNCTGASNGTKCGEVDGQTRWKCETKTGGGGCNLGSESTSYGSQCRCDNEECKKKTDSARCGSHPASCSTD